MCSPNRGADESGPVQITVLSLNNYSSKQTLEMVQCQTHIRCTGKEEYAAWRWVVERTLA